MAFFPDVGDIISERPNADARTGSRRTGVGVNGREMKTTRKENYHKLQQSHRGGRFLFERM
jgi:hypothetical protein